MGETPRKLNDEEVKLALSQLAHWRVVGGKLRRECRFKDFIQAWSFMSGAALLVQQMDHHPEWSNVYDRVTIDLVTHDAGGISRRDIELAHKLEALVTRMMPAGSE